MCFSWSTRWTPHAAQICISKINTLRQYNWWRQNPKHTWHTHSAPQSKYQSSSGVQLPMVFDPGSSIRHGCSCVNLHVCSYVCVYGTVCIRRLLDPGSIWLTQAVCIKGFLGVFWICSAPQQSSGLGEEMKGSVQRGVNRKNSTTLLSELFVILAKVVEKFKTLVLTY